MCCHLDQVHGKFIFKGGAFEENENGEKFYHVRGIYDRTPQTLADRISRWFLRLELLEKIAEIADECFHAFGFIFQRYTSAIVYQMLHNLHNGAHDIEHVLHSFCFLGDLARLLTGKFFEYQDEEHTQLAYWRSTSRVCHAVAHCFATAEFLHELKLLSLDRFEKTFKYASLFSALGYILWTISLIWQRSREIEIDLPNKKNDNFVADMIIHGGGFLFEAIHLTKAMNFLTPYSSHLSQAAAIAGMIHACFVVQRLMPEDSEMIDFHINEKDFSHSHEHTHDHSLDQDE